MDYPQISVKLDYFQRTAGTYAGYDRFGRINDQFWDNYGLVGTRALLAGDGGLVKGSRFSREGTREELKTESAAPGYRVTSVHSVDP